MPYTKMSVCFLRHEYFQFFLNILYHVLMIKGIGETIFENAIHKLAMSQAVASTCLLQIVRYI